jgi:hypothetical protein
LAAQFLSFRQNNAEGGTRADYDGAVGDRKPRRISAKDAEMDKANPILRPTEFPIIDAHHCNVWLEGPEAGLPVML